MKETIRLGIILLVIAAISGGILAYANSLTEPIITARQLEESTAAFGELLPDADEFGELDEALLEEIKESDSGVLEIFEALSGGEVIGYAFKVSAGGYGGQVETALVIDAREDIVSGAKVISHEETPGIGNRIEEDEFLASFKERSVDGELSAVASPADDNEVLMLSGATVSTKAVVNGSNKALEAYNAFLAE